MVIPFALTIAFVIFDFLKSFCTWALESINSYQLLVCFKSIKSILFFKSIKLKSIKLSLNSRSIKFKLIQSSFYFKLKSISTLRCNYFYLDLHQNTYGMIFQSFLFYPVNLEVRLLLLIDPVESCVK